MRIRLTLVLVVGFVLVGLGYVVNLRWGQAAVPAAAHEPTLARSGSAPTPVAQVVPVGAADSAAAKDGTTTVLSDDFSHKVVVEWSHSQTSHTPRDNHPFLGEFGPEVVTLVLRELPQHKLVHISFDLYVIRSWDGSNTYWGPDIWQLSLFDGPTLVQTTFNNCARVGSTPQAYPDNYPCPPHEAWTGCKEKETLGYEFDFHNFGGTVIPCDSVYHVDAWAPHEATKIAFQFAALYNDRCAQCAGELKDRTLADQSWGIANLKVQTADSLKKLTDAELKQNWERLASKDAVEGVGAMWQLVAAGDDAAQFIAKTLHAGDKPGEIDAWQLRRAKRALGIINTAEARHALWVLSEPASKYDTHDEHYDSWGLNP